MPYEQKFIMCDTYAHTIDMSKSSAEGARKYLLYVRFRVIKFKSNNFNSYRIGKEQRFKANLRLVAERLCTSVG